MNYSNLYVCGCSFFTFAFQVDYLKDREYYDELDDRSIYKKTDRSYLKNKSFYSFLDEEYSFDKIYNLSKGGTSYEYCFNTTMKFQNSNKLSNSLFILGISQLSRYYLYSNYEKKYIDYKPSYNTLPGLLKVYNNDTLNSFENYVNESFDEVERLYSMCYMYLSLIHYIKSFNNDVIVVNNLAIDKYEPITNGYYDILNYYIGDYLLKFNGYVSWRNFITSYDTKYSYQHPNTYDHRILSQKIINHINYMN